MRIFDKAEIIFNVPSSTGMGGEISCEFTILPKKNAKFRKIEAGLFCQETAITRGSSDSYLRKDVYTDNRIVQNATTIQADSILMFKQVFKLPDHYPPTFHGQNHMIDWMIRVRLDVPWWPDTRFKQEFNVLPVYTA